MLTRQRPKDTNVPNPPLPITAQGAPRATGSTRMSQLKPNSDTVQLAKQLISRPSVTPDDAGCQDLIVERLTRVGFKVERLPFREVANVWLRRGAKKPVFAFAGHTDVVPPGPLDQWVHPPFDPLVNSGLLYGRGAADMKGSLAAMVTACEQFIADYPDHSGSIALLITSDEEGPAVAGTARVIKRLEARDEKIDWCLIGEPSSSVVLGDVIKNGRRGSLSGNLRVEGQQGHVAYPHLADNPIHRIAPMLTTLATTEWDKGNRDFPPTTLQISNIRAGTGADNVIPGQVELSFNFRYSPELTPQDLKDRVHTLLDRHGVRYELQWTLSGEPFLTSEGALLAACQQAIKEFTGITARLSTSGGTSDGRFIAPTGAQVIELGPVNASIHKINEHVRPDDLDRLTKIYHRVMEILLA